MQLINRIAVTVTSWGPAVFTSHSVYAGKSPPCLCRRYTNIECDIWEVFHRFFPADLVDLFSVMQFILFRVRNIKSPALMVNIEQYAHVCVNMANHTLPS